jgi:hypothetical protein
MALLNVISCNEYVKVKQSHYRPGQAMCGWKDYVNEKFQ